jgi:altronate hydrolase
MTMRDFNELFIHLHLADSVAIARVDVAAGTKLRLVGGELLELLDAIPAGHKLALRPAAVGESLLRYGQHIGVVHSAIRAGEHVHTHNLGPGEMALEYRWRVVEPQPPQPSGRTFMGFRRANGRAGTRNYIAVVSTVNCSAHATALIARAFTPERLRDYPNVDGVIPIVHASGCSIPAGGLSAIYLRRTLANLAGHPNLAAVLYVSLGCEVNQLDDCSPSLGSQDFGRLAGPGLVIQEQGGFEATVRAGISAVERALVAANQFQREPVPLAELCLGLECGGSDSWSGVTANPLVGRVADALVAEGGTAVLSETPEIFGAESLLLDRVVSDDVGQKMAARFKFWLEQARRFGFSIDNNPSPGNKRGGLTTILEKSLGAAAKGGTTPLMGVYEYAEQIAARGFVFMDTPGNDPISMTGMLAGGCNLNLFTTGRGTPTGTNLAPTIKIASNSVMAGRLSDLIDYNAGQLLEGVDWDSARDRLLDLVVAVASGEKTRAEQHGLPEGEFGPWQPDHVL